MFIYIYFFFIYFPFLLESSTFVTNFFFFTFFIFILFNLFLSYEFFHSNVHFPSISLACALSLFFTHFQCGIPEGKIENVVYVYVYME